MALEMNNLNWVLKQKKDSRNVIVPPKEAVTIHPLHCNYTGTSKHPTTLQMFKSQKRSKTALIDPLAKILDGGDPLTDHSVKNDPLSAKEPLKGMISTNHCIKDVSPIIDNSLSWEKLRSILLTKFVTKQRLTFASSFLQTSESGTAKVQNNVADRTKEAATQRAGERVKTRLEQLDTLNDSCSSAMLNNLGELKGLTQEQFTKHLVALKSEMVEAWHLEERVKAFKIAMQSAKILSLSSPEMFYPCKFMLVTDILDKLGSLVYQRLKRIQDTSNPAELEETRKMWLYKIASVRELLPRLYLEASTAHCCLSSPMPNLLERLLRMTRGIGDPIVNAYAKMYVLKVAEKEAVSDCKNIRATIEDLCISIKWGWNGNGIAELEVSKEENTNPLAIVEKVLSPPFNWLLQCLVPKCPLDDLLEILKLAESLEGIAQYIMLMAILKNFPTPLLSTHSIPLLQIISNQYHLGENPCDMLTEMASIVNQSPPPEEERLMLLKAAWQLLVKFKNPNDYLAVAAPWVRFTAANFSCHELDTLLSEVLKRLSSHTAIDSSYSHSSLLTLINSALTYSPHSDILYTTGGFQGLLSIFQRETLGAGHNVGGVGEMKRLLETILLKQAGDFLDPTIIQLLLSLFSSLHDGINALTTQDERRQISQLITNFILKVTFGRDFEHQLQFYVDARASFSSLDPVLEALVQQVCRLQIETFEVVKGRHTSKTSAFEHACTAYCFITIPSLSSPVTRLKMYLLCGSIAMVNGCMGQGDACIKSAIREILELLPQQSSPPPANPKARSTTLPPLPEEASSALAILCSYLVAIPDPPDVAKPLYLYRGVVNGLRSLRGVDPYQHCCICLAVMKGMSSCAQSSLPYYFKGVDGIDTLFGGSDDIREEAQQLCSELLVDVVTYLKRSIGSADTNPILLASELMEMVITYCDIHHEKTQILADFLLKIINRKSVDIKLKSQINERYEASRNVSSS